MRLHDTSLSVQIFVRLSGQKLVLLRKRTRCELVRIKTCPAPCKRGLNRSVKRSISLLRFTGKSLSQVHEIMDEGDDRVNEAVLIPDKLDLKNMLETLTRIDEEILEKLCENEDVRDEALAVGTDEDDKWQ